MAVYVEGQNTRINKTKAYMELIRRVNLHPVGNWIPDTWAVKNPHPKKYILTWADPNKINKHKWYGAEIVTAEDGVKVYDLPHDDINKSKNRCERRGMVLMRSTVDCRAAKEARMALKSIASMNKDIQHFVSALSADASRGQSCEPRMLDESRTQVIRMGELEAQAQDTLGLQSKRRRVTPQSANDENRKRQGFKQSELQKALKEYIKEGLQSGNLSPEEAYRMQGIGMKDGVPHVAIPDYADAEAMVDEGLPVPGIDTPQGGDN